MRRTHELPDGRGELEIGHAHKHEDHPGVAEEVLAPLGCLISCLYSSLCPSVGRYVGPCIGLRVTEKVLVTQSCFVRCLYSSLCLSVGRYRGP